jgi:hypothetical protein
MRVASRTAPADYTAFVAANLAALRAVSRELTGHERLAESIADGLLEAVALRWWWLHRRRKRTATRAGAYLDRLIRREVRSWPVSQPPGYRFRDAPAGSANPGSDMSAVETAGPPRIMSDFAARVWGRSRRIRWRRRIVAALVLAAIAAGALAGGTGQPSDSGEDIESGASS